MKVTSFGSLRITHLIFAGVLLLRLVTLARLTGSPFLLPSGGDMHFYDQWARRILHGQLTDYQAFYGLPLYAYLLALFYLIFGTSPFPPAFLPICSDAGTAVLLYKIAVRAFGDAGDEQASPATLRRGQLIGVLAALGWAFFTAAQAYSIALMPTSLAIFVYWLLVWFVIKREETPRLWIWFGYGLAIGVTAMAVATILFVTPLLCAAAISSRRKYLAPILLALGIAAGTSPCWIHNGVIARDPVFLSAHSGVNFWIGNNPDANGYPHFPGLRSDQTSMLKDSIDAAQASAGRPLKRSAVSAYWSAKARDYIAQNFGQWLKLMGTKLRNFWSAFEYDDVGIIAKLREHNVVFPGLRFGLVAALGLPGLYFAVRRFPHSRWIAAAIALAMLAVLPVFVTERYRLLVVPGLLLFAGAALRMLWEDLASARVSDVAAQIGAITIAAILVSWPQRDPALWALEPYNSGSQALELKDFAMARQKLERAYSYAPGSAEINFALGNLAHAENNESSARGYYDAALRIDPEHEGALNNLGVIALEENNWPSAAEYFSRSIARDPANAKSHYLLAKARLRADDTAGAQREIDRAMKLAPTQAEFIQLSDEISARTSQRSP